MSDPIVLVVDDEEALLQLMVRRLSRMPVEIDQAEDGRTALAKIEANRYDLVVTDIYMPGVSGLELLKQAKESDPLTQVIVVTGAATLENAVEALNNGAFAYLTKPFEHMSVFDNVVSRALQFRSLMLDNARMAEIQKRRGDMLEEEVTERVSQLQRSRREVLDLLACIPDGVLVIDEQGRVVMSNPAADRYLKEDREREDHALQTYLESLHEEWASDEWEVDLGRGKLTLSCAPLPAADGHERKVVVIKQAGGSPETLELVDALVELKHGLAWLYTQELGEHVTARVALLAKIVNDLENMVQADRAVPGEMPPA